MIPTSYRGSSAFRTVAGEGPTPPIGLPPGESIQPGLALHPTGPVDQDPADVATGASVEHRGRVRVERGQKRVRGFLGGQLVFDTRAPVLVWEVPYYPAYYVPLGDVRATLIPAPRREQSPSRGEAEYFDVKVEGRTVREAAWRYPRSPLEALRELVRFEWKALDEWLEEDEPIYVHPRDPYTRVDVLASSRHVEVVVEGVKVAESHQPRILFETGLPPRYYLPLADVRLELLVPSGTTTRCPYKGTATYWSLRVEGRLLEDLVWTYRAPFAEAQKIAGLVAFYNEKVDLYVDGELQQRPRTPFSD
ncbi:DUF427 domain-containing protein [Anaeromyxobacter oryzae]|uniref:DUF427 domain-containing protein n=1 Tax=Anaeromyxobacter oryzae TaxID=2918170 RepID=A0ABM7WPX0_9BACT|nr:DUF427 domain-containing protein [Anaeromyxobacter oryzae]BDG01512.1 hypothetical protein AMOR_05080 [Anaeromyxobacter oryzae]